MPETLFDTTVFEKYDADNPKIWKMFCKLAHRLIRKGRTHFSADAILHKIRFDTAISGKGDVFKINNNFSAYYARKFMNNFPLYKGFFQLRKSKG